MGSSKPKAVQTPFKQDQTQANTYAPISIGETPEARGFLDVPLDFGDDVDLDPGVGRRTALAEQDVDNRYNSAFNAGVPAWIREISRAKEKRDVQAQGAYERQNADYLRQNINNARRQAMTTAELARRERLLPGIFQTGGSGSSSGYGTTVVQPQPGFLQRLALTAVGGAAQGLSGGFAGG